jgi:hypothetical protein
MRALGRLDYPAEREFVRFAWALPSAISRSPRFTRRPPRPNRRRPIGSVPRSALEKQKGIAMKNRTHRGFLTAVMIASLSLFGLSARSGHAATITVNSTSWNSKSTSACDLPEAVEAVKTQKAYGGCTAASGTKFGTNDTILVPGGQYNAAAPLTITRDVVVQGVGNIAGVGAESSTTAQTIIATGSSFSPAGSSGLFVLNDDGSPITVTLEGIVFEGGPYPVSAVYAHGLRNSMVTISGSAISGFQRSGISLDGFSLNLQNSNVYANFNCASPCDNFTAGFASTAAGTGTGGGVSVDENSGTLNVLNSTIANNIADFAGGGIYYVGSPGMTSNIVSSTISDNIAAANTAPLELEGFPDCIGNGTPSDLCSVQMGAAGSAGGIYFEAAPGSPEGTFTIGGSTVAFNTACIDGGGIVAYQNNSGASSLVVDSIVSDNEFNLFCNLGSPGAPAGYQSDIESDGTLAVKSSLVLDTVGGFSDGGGNIENQDPNLEWNNGLPNKRGGVAYGPSAAPGDLAVAYNIPVHAVTMTPVSPTGGIAEPDTGLGFPVAEQTAPSVAVDYLSTIPAAPTPSTDQSGFPRGVPQGGNIGGVFTNAFDLGATEFDPHMQAETLIVAQYSGPAPTVYPASGVDSNASNGKGMVLFATAIGQYMTFYFVSPADGCYHVWLRAEKGKYGGQFELLHSLSIDGPYVPWGTYKYPVDLYAVVGAYETYDLTLSSTALHMGSPNYFQIKVTGPISNKTGRYYVPVDFLDVAFEEYNGTPACV